MNNRKWKEFDFIEIFDINGGFYNKKPENKENGTIPFIGATDSNNGITEFYSYETIEKSSKTGVNNNTDISNKLFKGNCICVTNNGSVGYAYYQPASFTCSHDVNPLYLKNYKLNRQLAMFLISAIQKQRVCFEYSRKWRPKRMRKSKILLPVDENENPDYKYMTDVIVELTNKDLNNYIDYCKSELGKIRHVEIKKYESLTWKKFKISDLFDVVIGKNVDGNKVDKYSGSIPYITRRESYNGLDGFINYNSIYLNNIYPVITIGNETAKPFVQVYPFYTGTKVNIMIPKFKANKYILLFICRSLEMHRQKYSYSYTINSTRLKEQIILLPVNNDGCPNYKYMEQYIKNVMYKQYNKYLQFLSI